MLTDTADTRQRSYRAHEQENLLSEVESVLCVLHPRSILLGGFNAGGQAILAHFCDYAPPQPSWDTSFFESRFMSETLLGMPQLIKAVFVSSEEEMLIPESLFQEKNAHDWLQKLNGSSPNNVLHQYKLAQPAARYAFMLPAAMEKLLHRYFGSIPLLPLAAYQFHKPANEQYLFHCLAGDGSATASLFHSGRLLWHQQFACDVAEDLAWKAASLCRELHIPRIDMHIELALLSDQNFYFATDLERYFPKIKWTRNLATEDGPWAPALFLLQQLFACVL
ncbi:MAG: DUF3822 family protein [Bacteroidetes bacterium]|nr:DUF3822 family protein [Bacteroidota bacterium]MBS1630558.1 DUF3822 family protein [Bacteroidota bacterium]